MEEWFQSIAVGVAVMVGLISPPSHLHLDCLALRAPQGVVIQVETVGAETRQVKDFVLAGNSLTIVYAVSWGSLHLTQSKTIQYKAWQSEFSVVEDGAAEDLVTNDPTEAFRAWRTLGPELLGSRTQIEPNLDQPLYVKATLVDLAETRTAPKGRVQALWSYKSPERHLVFRSWLEIPQ